MSRKIKTTRKKSESGKSGKEDLSKYNPLVIAVAKRYSNFFPQLDMEELVAEGNAGLLEASLKFKKDRKTLFSTYAWFWIVKNIQSYISKNVNIIETPQNVRNILSSVKKIIDEEAKSGKDISLNKISKILGVKASDISDAMAINSAVSNVVSLDKEIDTGEQTRSFYESVEDKSQPEVFDSMVRDSDTMNLDEMRSRLSDNENAVLSFRFALDGYTGKKMSIKDIADKLKISQAKVRDLENSALLKLKGMIKDVNE